jgi:hypothetical protein
LIKKKNIKFVLCYVGVAYLVFLTSGEDRE